MTLNLYFSRQMKLMLKYIAPVVFFGLFSCAQQNESGKQLTEKEVVNSKLAIAQMLDNWHHAAAVADEEVFFGSMTEDCIYLGTDASEKWRRDELKHWAAKAFDKDTAWAFTPFEREIYLNEKGDLAWFDEKLNTWMGICRGSGVVVKTAEGWKLKHYNLAVTIANEKIEEFKAIEQ
ncbi:hypothetical protein GC194_06895 [bacterium]|nr:hypothetical protein [bacterium]